MLHLHHNKANISKQELIEIEESFNRCLLVDNNTPELNVLAKSRTDLYGHVLSIFIRLNIHTIFRLNTSQMLDFLIDVANKYTEAVYHTFYHAVDIVTMLYYLSHDLNASLTNIDLSFLMVAALCHDIGHPGFNNSFQIKNKTDLYAQYGDRSTLESYSVDLTIQLLNKHNIRHVEMNETIKDLILSTDMEYHQDLVNQINQPQQNKISLCRILLHAADISNMARPWLISKQWSDLIVQEFFAQGDEEKRLKMTISPGMDRQMCSQQSISLKFHQLILPFFESLVNIIPKSKTLVHYLVANRLHWEHVQNRPVITYKRIRYRPTVLYQPIELYDNIDSTIVLYDQ